MCKGGDRKKGIQKKEVEQGSRRVEVDWRKRRRIIMKATGREVKLYEMRRFFSDEFHEGSVTICETLQRERRFQDLAQVFTSNN